MITTKDDCVKKNLPKRAIKSFVRRGRHLTSTRKNAWKNLWGQYGLDANEQIDLLKVFSRETETILEIGFGMGDSLIQMAIANPETNFIGIEVHTPGVGALFARMQQEQVKNLRIFSEDAITVLEKAIPDNSIDKVLLFFPDPWPKIRHHKRRLVQLAFVKLILRKLKLEGQFHIATDSKDYALHSVKVIEQISEFSNLAGEKIFSPKPEYRILTKFEKRGMSLGHEIWDLIFVKNKNLGDCFTKAHT